MIPKNLIALDLDGVVADFHQVVIDILNVEYNRSLTIKDWTSWYAIGNILWRNPDSLFKTEKEGREAESQLFKDAWSRWGKILVQEPRAIEYANALQNYGKVILLTGRQGFFDFANVSQWCAWNGLITNGLFCLNTDSGMSKSDFAPPFNIYIDDNPSTVVAASKTGAMVYMRDQPWNQDVKVSPNLLRIYTLKEILDDLEAKKDA